MKPRLPTGLDDALARNAAEVEKLLEIRASLSALEELVPPAWRATPDGARARLAFQEGIRLLDLAIEEARDANAYVRRLANRIPGAA